MLPVRIDRGRGPAIVLLHGLGNNYKSWSFVLDHIDYTKNRIIALDLLGFGDAPKPKDSRYTAADHAAAVTHTLHQLGIKKSVLAGHSMGCIVAIEAVKQSPNMVRGLLLAGAPLYKAMPRDDWWGHVRRSGGMYFKIFSFLQRNPGATQAGGKLADDLLPFVKGMEITDKTWPAFHKSLEHTIMQFESYQDAMKLTIPILFIDGVFDAFIIHKNNRIVARRNAQAHIKTTLGPHELTPRQGKKVASLLQRFSATLP